MNEDSLNESQLEAVRCIDAPSLVIAGAGSGKTRVLTYKVAYLLENGYGCLVFCHVNGVRIFIRASYFSDCPDLCQENCH